MSSEYFYSASEDMSEKKKSAGKIEKGIKKVLVVMSVILAAQLIWLFGVSPFIPFSNVEIHAFSPLTRAEILILAGIDENSSFASTNASAVRERLSSHILAESAVVIKRFPDRLSIFLNPRIASAVTLADINSGRDCAFLIDCNGVLFKTADADSSGIANLPVLSGIENPQIGTRLPAPLVSLVKNLDMMALTSSELLSAISEIRIERKTWDGFELVLFPVHSEIRVRVENNLTEDTIRYMLLMLSIFDRETQRPQEIDFRSGIGSYKVEGQSL